MTILDDNKVVVNTSEELKKVLEEINDFNYIYFGANISLSSGIIISSSKKEVTIDGTYNEVRYSFEDMKSLGSADTISVRNTAISKVTVKNIDVTGYNYYGIIYVPEDNNFQNTVIEYNNLKYVGPQITFHPSGLSRYIDCDIKIVTSNASANEVAECNRIEIGGTTTITHESTSDSSFWFKGKISPYFKILENANVKIESINRELFYGTNNLDFEVLNGATFNLTTALGMGYGSNSTRNVLIDKNAFVKITQTKQNGSYPTWYSTGSFIMNENSSLIMENNYNNISTSNYNIYFRTTSASLTLNSPKKLVLYNSKANVIYSAQSINFNLTFSRINTWNTAKDLNNAGSLDDLPTYSWYKNINTSNLVGTLTSTKTTITSSNYTEEELNILPDLNNFKLNDCKVLSVGSMPFNLYPITDESTEIKGYTMLNSKIKINYLEVEETITADENGYFELTLAAPLQIGTKITFLANDNNFIYQEKTVEIVYAGELVLSSVPINIKFKPIAFSINPVLCLPEEKIIIEVVDSRIDSSSWSLYAMINHDLMADDGRILTDSIVFINEENEIKPLSNEKLLIYQGKSNEGSPKSTNISWQDGKGIMLKLENEFLENKVEYTAVITWILEK